MDLLDAFKASETHEHSGLCCAPLREGAEAAKDVWRIRCASSLSLLITESSPMKVGKFIPIVLEESTFKWITRALRCTAFPDWCNFPFTIFFSFFLACNLIIEESELLFLNTIDSSILSLCTSFLLHYMSHWITLKCTCIFIMRYSIPTLLTVAIYHRPWGILFDLHCICISRQCCVWFQSIWDRVLISPDVCDKWDKHSVALHRVTFASGASRCSYKPQG